MRVLILGSNGMLGQAIVKAFRKKNVLLITAAHTNADYTFDFLDISALQQCFFAVKPDIVINVAAIVNLQYCEERLDLAYQVNADLCVKIAELCRQYGSYFVHVSTDHYYLGDSYQKHDENAPVRLVNAYACSKYAGECFVRTYEKSLILRTNIVGFRGDSERLTFVEWAIDAMQRKQHMYLFDNFYTSSIHTVQFANILYDILFIQPFGICNLSSSTVSSKKEFIIALAKNLFGSMPDYEVQSLSAIQGVKRADSLGLDVKKIENLLGYAMPDMEQVIYSIKKEYNEKNGGRC